ncbi:MAG: type III polyketide synthase, partial [Gammaproteobacteria bacterium]|nr:type III polyketide synthase [Gammaproteobacteria bacterium]
MDSKCILPRIISVGTANPGRKYSQQEIMDKMRINDERIINVFKNSHIKTRFLTLKEENGVFIDESQEELLKKHLNFSLEAGAQAIKEALFKANLQVYDIEYICVVTSTGFLSPGLSAHIINKLKLPMNCQRTDIVGMGCCAGLNGLNTTSNWVQVNPGKYGILLCVEICSAAYVFDNTIDTAVVNSLFGDAAAAVILRAGGNEEKPVILGFSSFLIENTLKALEYVWDPKFNKFSFRLQRTIPYSIGLDIEQPVNVLLNRFQVKKRNITHWVVHGGGKKVIDAIKYNLGLSAYDMNCTTNVLAEYGNLSSAS